MLGSESPGSEDADSVLPSLNSSCYWIITHSPDPTVDPFRCGKWLLHVDAEHVDEVWQCVAMATADGKLGAATKVSTRGSTHPGSPHVICVYTRDYLDTGDVKRVLSGLRALGFNQRLSYKEDAATHASKYGRGAALYVSQPGSLEFESRRDPVESDGLGFL